MSQLFSPVEYEISGLPGAEIKLGTEDIHVWYASLNRPAEPYQEILSLEEKERADRYRFAQDKNGFIIRHGILRNILSRYTGIDPGMISYGVNGNGKPFLANRHDGPELFFNQTHSGDIAAYAITGLGDIGIDIEQVREIPDIPDIARSYFSRGEYLTLKSLCEESRIQGFYTCWTRKEAFIKAVGEGLYYRLDKFEVSLTPNEPARIKSIHDPEQSADDWYMENLNLPPGLTGALVVKGKPAQIIHSQWT